jgi:hypothetical protein
MPEIKEASNSLVKKLICKKKKITVIAYSTKATILIQFNPSEIK